jgi:hypothetical protein
VRLVITRRICLHSGALFASNGNLLAANRSANNVMGITPVKVAGVFATGFYGPGGAAFAPTAIPEPSTFAALAGLGALGFAMWRGRRQGACMPAYQFH